MCNDDEVDDHDDDVCGVMTVVVLERRMCNLDGIIFVFIKCKFVVVVCFFRSIP